MRNREKQRELKKKTREESLDRRNHEGYLDLTPFIAIERMRREERLASKKVGKGLAI